MPRTSGNQIVTTLLIVSLSVCCTVLSPDRALAKVSGECANCHTMHTSQSGGVPAGWDLAGGPRRSLIANSCVGCHSDTSSPVKQLGASRVPVVFITGGEPADYLAGGNFWWVATGKGADDTKGHNVLGISGVDQHLTQAPGNVNGGGLCASHGCHGSLARENTVVTGLGSGCEGCHLKVRHHAEDRNDPVGGGYRVSAASQGYYRFLGGHQGAALVDRGAQGIEDGDWQRLSLATKDKHNEYMGKPGGNDDHTTLDNGTVSAYCCGCHGDFHLQSSGTAWIRHPSDAVLPDRTHDSEYEAYTQYDPSAPVARQGLTAVSNAVTKGSDVVMCLSCHRPHGSPNKDILRWNYDGMVAGTQGGSAGTGCFVCHTGKDGV